MLLSRHALTRARPATGAACPVQLQTRRPASCIRAVDNYKKEAAALLVDKFVKSGTIVGLGSGELSSLVIEEIGQRLAKGALSSVQGVPAADVAASEAAYHGVPLHIDSASRVDLFFEQADMLDAERSAAIVGVVSEPQQPQLLRSLAMAQTRANKVVLLVDHKNVVPHLRGTLPLLIENENWEECAEEVDDLVIGDAEVWRRSVPGTPDPNPRATDAPYISAEGHNILDLKYEGDLRLFGEPATYSAIEDELLDIPGVVASGLLLNVAAAAVVASPSGPKVLQLVCAEAEAAQA